MTTTNDQINLALSVWDMCGLVSAGIYNKRAPTKLYAARAQRLLFMCAAHESRFLYRRQQGVPDGVGAYGLFQIELDTAEYCLDWALKRTMLRDRCNNLLGVYIQYLVRSKLERELQTPYGDLWCAVLARIKFLTIPAAIPWSVADQADYAKQWYNTAAGAATAGDYADAYLHWHTVVSDRRVMRESVETDGG
jgi:hypothetical protein